MPAFDGLGKALRWLREKGDQRQYEVARAARVTKAMLSAYETGKQNPSLPSLERILEALGANLADLARALDLVNERRPRRAPATNEAAAAPDVRTILGVEELAGEEEEALGRMLEGFHSLLRYYHRAGSRVPLDD